MALSRAHQDSLSDVRTYEIATIWFTVIFLLIGAASAAAFVCNGTPGGVIFSLGCFVASIWCDYRRIEYKSNILRLQKLDT